MDTNMGIYRLAKKTNETIKIDTDRILVIVSPYINPKLDYYVPIDESFIEGISPHKDHITDYDEKHWYPKVAFQMESVNAIAASGPATGKLPKESSAEAHYSYKFHFKLGGCPPPMDKICNPITQPIYPVPNNQQPSTSLQNPGTSIYTYLYNFDERRGQLTQKAAKRIKKTTKLNQLFCHLQDKAGWTSQHPPKQHRHKKHRHRKKKKRVYTSSSSDSEESKTNSDSESSSC